MISVDPKPIMLSELVAALSRDLSERGDIMVRWACDSEHLVDDLVIVRAREAVYIDGYMGVRLEAGDIVIWGDLG